jgi:CcmD family protein
MKFFFLAYLAVWFALFGYLFRISRKCGLLEKRLTDLEK